MLFLIPKFRTAERTKPQVSGFFIVTEIARFFKRYVRIMQKDRRSGAFRKEVRRS